MSRGFEIGTFNLTILSSVLKKRSAKWPSFAEGYICDIICVVHTFIKKALTISCKDQRLGQNILSFLLDELSDKYRQALSITNFLLRIERESKPMTQNHCFNSNLQKWSEPNLLRDMYSLTFILVGRNASLPRRRSHRSPWISTMIQV